MVSSFRNKHLSMPAKPLSHSLSHGVQHNRIDLRDRMRFMKDNLATSPAFILQTPILEHYRGPTAVSSRKSHVYHCMHKVIPRYAFGGLLCGHRKHECQYAKSALFHGNSRRAVL